MSARPALFAALALVVTTAQAAPEWTHTPDGRWMFVDPDKPQGMCDFQHHCYPDAPTAEAAPPLASPPQPDDPPLAEPPPSMAGSPMCDEIRHRLFRDLYEVEKAHRICGP